MIYLIIILIFNPNLHLSSILLQLNYLPQDPLQLPYQEQIHQSL